MTFGDRTCPLCREQMRIVELSEWRLRDKVAVTYICEKCTYTDRVIATDDKWHSKG